MLRFTITMAPELNLGDLAHAVESHGGRVHSLKIVTGDDDVRFLVGYMKVAPGRSREEMVHAVSQIPGVTDSDWS